MHFTSTFFTFVLLLLPIIYEAVSYEIVLLSLVMFWFGIATGEEIEKEKSNKK